MHLEPPDYPHPFPSRFFCALATAARDRRRAERAHAPECPPMSDQTDSLICPKCQNPMRSYERSGIVVDQCTGCRGVFLDRGELERLVDAEGDYYERESRREPDREEHKDPPRKKKKREFLSDFLDFG